jgi:xylulokinase
VSYCCLETFSRLIPPRLDDKLFSFWFLQADGFPFSHVKGIFRFETGIKVNEFRDLRANPRCLLESQFLSFRVRWSRILTSGIFGNTVGRGGAISNPNTTAQSGSPLNNLGLTFDPYDYSTLPSRILATGAAANFPSVVNIIGDIFNAPVVIPTSQIDAAQVTPHRNAPAKGHPSRASMGGAYVARWVWGRERGGIRGGGTFEDDLRKVFSKRWTMTGGSALKTSANAVPQLSNSAVSTPVVGGLPTGGSSRGGSGSSTPYSHHPRSGLGTTVVVEEEEDEIDIDVATGRLRSLTTSAITGPLQTKNSSLSLLSNSALAASALNGQNPAPFIGSELLPPDTSNTETVTTTSAPLTPVTVMTSTSENDLQVGLGKVTDPDVDSFMSYAAIVPEYCRLEGMLVKGIV